MILSYHWWLWKVSSPRRTENLPQIAEIFQETRRTVFDPAEKAAGQRKSGPLPSVTAPDRCHFCRCSRMPPMKADIHPEYTIANVHCSCGNQFYTRSTKSDLHVELCSACHPFYTGKQKLVDTGGRVERFQRRAAKRSKAGTAGT